MAGAGASMSSHFFYSLCIKANCFNAYAGLIMFVSLDRKLLVPLPPLHPDHPWPSSLSVWVGPDGVPILPRHVGHLLAQRGSLRVRQVRKSLGQKGPHDELGYLGNGETFGWLDKDPAPCAAVLV